MSTETFVTDSYLMEGPPLTDGVIVRNFKRHPSWYQILVLRVRLELVDVFNCLNWSMFCCCLSFTSVRISLNVYCFYFWLMLLTYVLLAMSNSCYLEQFLVSRPLCASGIRLYLHCPDGSCRIICLQSHFCQDLDLVLF